MPYREKSDFSLHSCSGKAFTLSNCYFSLGFDNHNETTIPNFITTSLFHLSHHILGLENLMDVKYERKFKKCWNVSTTTINLSQLYCRRSVGLIPFSIKNIRNSFTIGTDDTLTIPEYRRCHLHRFHQEISKWDVSQNYCDISIACLVHKTYIKSDPKPRIQCSNFSRVCVKRMHVPAQLCLTSWKGWQWSTGAPQETGKMVKNLRAEASLFWDAGKDKAT